MLKSWKVEISKIVKSWNAGHWNVNNLIDSFCNYISCQHFNISTFQDVGKLKPWNIESLENRNTQLSTFQHDRCESSKTLELNTYAMDGTVECMVLASNFNLQIELGRLGGGVGGGGLSSFYPFPPLTPRCPFWWGFAFGGGGQGQKQHFSNTFRNILIVWISAALVSPPGLPKGCKCSWNLVVSFEIKVL